MCLLENRSDFDRLNVRTYDAVNGNIPIKRGQIRYVALHEVDPDLRNDLGKTRPCIIIQSDEYNEIDDATVYVIPLSNTPMYNSLEDALIGLRINGRVSLLCFNTIKAVERKQVENYIQDCPEDLIKYIDQYLIKRYGIEPPVIEKIVEIQKSESTNSQSNPITVLTPLENDKYLQDYKEYGAKFLKQKITPEYVQSLSISDCKNLIKIHEALGDEYFYKAPGYTDKTFNLSLKRAKSRVSAFSKTSLEVVESY